MAPTCPEIRSLQDLLDGTLPPKAHAELSEHLEACLRCRANLDKLATDGKSFSELAQSLQHRRGEPEAGLKRVLDEAASATGPMHPSSSARAEECEADSDATQGELPADARQELPFLSPSSKPGNLGRLGHYEILGVIGKGGFGVVLKAFDEKLHRMVAIKVLSAAYAAVGSARKRFIREARAAAAVKNEHVVAIYNVQDEEQPPYLVMELIDGISLQDKLDKNGALGVKEILRIGMQTAEGLAAAHKQGLVHRDIKPANILLENGVERVKITDFGLARAVDDASLTQSGTVTGTPMYMSPEQAEGLAIDHRSDLFSLGTVLYAMCTGHPPFRASGTHAVLKRVIDATPRPIREINPEIPDALADAISKLHAKQPEERFQTAREVAEVLGAQLATAQLSARDSSTGERRDRVSASVHVPRSKAPIARTSAIWLISLLGVVAAALVLFAFWQADQPPSSDLEKNRDAKVKLDLRPVPPAPEKKFEAKAPTAPPLPKQPTEVLKFLVGSWQTETVVVEPPMKSTGLFTYELVARGKFLRGYGTDDKGGFESLVVQTWDPEEGNFQGWFFSSQGDMTGPGIGNWNAGKNVLLWEETLADGTRATHEFTFVDGNRVTTHLIHRDKDNEVVFEMRHGMKRLAEAAAETRMPTDPKRPPEMKVLDVVVGDWRNFMTVKTADMPKKPMAVTALLHVRPVLGGRLLECRETNEIDGERTYWLTAYDGRLKKYRFWHFSPLFGAAEIEGTWTEATKTLRWRSLNDSHEARWTFRGEEERDVAFTVKDPKGNLQVEVEGVSKKLKPKPFALRSKAPSAERYFDTLKEAIAGAGSGDTIEIHGNGPFVSDLVRIKKALCIRAADGFHPIFTFEHEPLTRHWQGLIDVAAPLVLEGIEFRYAKPTEGGVVQLFLVKSDLRMARCRVVAQGNSNAIALSYGSLELDGCEIFVDLWSGIRWNFDAASKIVVNDSVLAGPEAITLHAHAVREKIHELDIRIQRSTLVGGLAIMSWLVDQVQPKSGPGAKPIHVHATDSVFSLSDPKQRVLCLMGNVEGEYQDAASARALLERAFRWTDGLNLYPQRSLIGLADFKKYELLANGHFCPNLDEWHRFWGIPKSEAIQGTARFHEADILAKARTNIHAFLPGDFRLARGGPGQGVLAEGRDLGADVDLLGPGEGYNRWRKTAAFREWRTQVDALLQAAVKGP